MPINAGVPEFKKALKDLDAILKRHEQIETSQKVRKDFAKFRIQSVIKEKERLEKLVDLNSQREAETYSKMFTNEVCITDLIKE